MLEWDAGAGAGTAMQALVGGPASADYSLATEYTTQPGAVQAGGSYRFRVSAHNTHGWGPAAPTQPIDGFTTAGAIIVAASTPGTPAAPSTSIENIYVKIAWSAPAANSAPIDGYYVSIARSDGVYVLESTYCDGFTSEAVRDLTMCLVPMSVLRGDAITPTSPYGLARG